MKSSPALGRTSTFNSELIKIEDAGPAVRQRAERDLQVALDVITSLGLSPVEEMEEAAND